MTQREFQSFISGMMVGIGILITVFGGISTFVLHVKWQPVPIMTDK